MVKKRNFTNAFLEEDNKQEDINNEKTENEIDNHAKEEIIENISKLNLTNKNKQDDVIKIEAEQVATINSTTIFDNDNNEKEIVQETSIDNESITKFVKNKLTDTKKRMNLFYGNTTAFGKATKKPKFSEMYSGVTVSMNRDLNEIIEYLVANSTYNKAQLLELLIITGLENINFD